MAVVALCSNAHGRAKLVAGFLHDVVEGTDEGCAAEVGRLRTLEDLDSLHIDKTRGIGLEDGSTVDVELATRVNPGVAVEG